MTEAVFPARGRCTCGQVGFEMLSEPMIVHCCHCTWCQRETGSAFVLNAMIESDRVALRAGTTEMVEVPSASGRGQSIARCPACRVALWSHYGGNRRLSFVRVGSLNDPNCCPPDVQIYTESKQSWVVLSNDRPCFGQYYRRSEVWPPASIERLDTFRS